MIGLMMLLTISGIADENNDILIFKGVINSLIVSIDGYNRTFTIELIEYPSKKFITNAKQLMKCGFKDGETIKGKNVIIECKKKSSSEEETYIIINCKKI